MSDGNFWRRNSASRGPPGGGGAPFYKRGTNGNSAAQNSFPPSNSYAPAHYKNNSAGGPAEFVTATKTAHSGNHKLPEDMNPTDVITVNIPVVAPDKDKVYRWLIGRNGTNIKLMQSTGVSIQVDRRLGNICLEGEVPLVEKVKTVIERLASDTASPSVGCGGKKVMTAIKRLIADCAAYHAQTNKHSSHHIGLTADATNVPRFGSGANRQFEKPSNFQNPPAAPQAQFVPQNPAQSKGSGLQRYNALAQQSKGTVANKQSTNPALSYPPSRTANNYNDRGIGMQTSNAYGASCSSPQGVEENVSVTIQVTAPDKDKVYRWLIGRNGTNIKLMQSTGVQIQVDRKTGTVLLEGNSVLVQKVRAVIERLMFDTASPLVGCGGKKVMTAIKRLIADCASLHAKNGYNGPSAIATHQSAGRETQGAAHANGHNMNSYRGKPNHPVNRNMQQPFRQRQFSQQNTEVYICTIQIAVGEGKREKAYSRLIGRGGNVIRRMERHSGAEIKVEKHDGNVNIRGKKEAVEKARMMVSSVLTGVQNDNFGNEFDDLLQLPGGNLMGRVIMPRLMSQHQGSLTKQFNNPNGRNQQGQSSRPGFMNTTDNKYLHKETANHGGSNLSGNDQKRTDSRFRFAAPPQPEHAMYSSNKLAFQRQNSNGLDTNNHGAASSIYSPSGWGQAPRGALNQGLAATWNGAFFSPESAGGQYLNQDARNNDARKSTRNNISTFGVAPQSQQLGMNGTSQMLQSQGGSAAANANQLNNNLPNSWGSLGRGDTNAFDVPPNAEGPLFSLGNANTNLQNADASLWGGYKAGSGY